jgi:cob(I)alamin adenosyltransferase
LGNCWFCTAAIFYYHDKTCFDFAAVDSNNTDMLEKGLVEIYTGDGKGKTTAAFGLALRAAGQGNSVLIYQFLKPYSVESGERTILKDGLAKIKVDCLDQPWDMAKSFKDENQVARMRSAIHACLQKISESARERTYDLLILDEIVFCLSKGLARLEDVRDIVENKDSSVEIVLTGRGATKELIELADLVTEMKNIKHPFDDGLSARRGIEF